MQYKIYSHFQLHLYQHEHFAHKLAPAPIPASALVAQGGPMHAVAAPGASLIAAFPYPG